MNQQLKTTLPRAEVAAHTVTSGQYAKAQMQMQLVEQEIRKAIDLGKRTIGNDGRLETAVIDQLIALGYKAKNDSNRNEEYWSIGW